MKHRYVSVHQLHLKLVCLFSLIAIQTSFATFREFTNSAGKTMFAEIQHKTDTSVTMKLKRNGKITKIPITAFSWDGQEYIRGWAYGQDEEEETLGQPKKKIEEDEPNHGEVPDGNRLYPRTKEEMRDGLKEIE